MADRARGRRPENRPSKERGRLGPRAGIPKRTRPKLPPNGLLSNQRGLRQCGKERGAEPLRGSGGRMLFAVCSPFCALQACCESDPVEIVMSDFDIFVSSLNIFTLDHMKNLENTTFDGNTGHFHEEIDLADHRACQATEDRVMLRRRGTHSGTVQKTDEFPQMQFLDKLHLTTGAWS